jgi:hypothetical protein
LAEVLPLCCLLGCLVLCFFVHWACQVLLHLRLISEAGLQQQQQQQDMRQDDVKMKYMLLADSPCKAKPGLDRAVCEQPAACFVGACRVGVYAWACCACGRRMQPAAAEQQITPVKQCYAIVAVPFVLKILKNIPTQLKRAVVAPAAVAAHLTQLAA